MKITSTLLTVLRGAAILPGPAEAAHGPQSRLVFMSQAGWGEVQGPSLYSLDWYHNALVQQITYSEQAIGHHPFWRRVY